MAALLTYSFLPHTEILLELYTHTYIHRERWEEVDVCVYFQGKEIYHKQERLNFRKINVFHIFPIKEKETTQTFLQMQKGHLPKSHPLPSYTPSLQEKRTFKLEKGMCAEPIVPSNGDHWGSTPRPGAGGCPLPPLLLSEVRWSQPAQRATGSKAHTRQGRKYDSQTPQRGMHAEDSRESSKNKASHQK